MTQTVLEDRYKPVINNKELKGLLSHFVNIYVEDSSTISLQEDLKDTYKGSGGDASSSALKIHLTYNVTVNSIKGLKISSANKSDAKFAKDILSIINKGDLVLRDLGYFNIDILNSINQKEAFFISRYFLATTLYVNNKKVDLLEFLNSKKEYDIIDESVHISSHKLPVRLIAFRVSDEIFNQRVRVLNKGYKQRRKTPKKSTIELQRYVIFITNIPKEIIASSHIGTIYRLRWCIELIFKRWKSIFKINRVTGKKGNRTLCFIYAKIIAILLINNFENYALLLAKKLKRELSYEKFFKWILTRDRFQRLFALEFTIDSFLNKLKQNIPRMLKDKRKKRPSTIELLINSASFYDCNDILYSQKGGLG